MIFKKYFKKSKKQLDEIKIKKVKPAQNNAASNELLTVKLRYKKPDGQESKKLEVPVLANQLSKEPSNDFQFIMAVAMFGQLLRDSDFKGDATYQKVIDLAKSGIDNDEHGYRREFIRLAEAVNQMQK